MSGFISCAEAFNQLLPAIVNSPELHAKWLNTLSYLEHCGARKIAACQHPSLVREEMLKHAAEEFRHAHHLKRQIKKVSANHLEDYSLSFILGGMASRHYLDSLDVQMSRYLSRRVGLSKAEVKAVAYLLVTYAIELRAAELYPLYDAILRRSASQVTVKCILLEEKEHLEEMQKGLEQLPSGFAHAEHVCRIEARLCQNWLQHIYPLLM